MAAKNKQRKKPKPAKIEEDGGDMEPAGEDGAEGGAGGAEGGAGGGGQEEKEEEELDLEEVLRLGGTQADYVLLAALDDHRELVDGGKKDAIDDLEDGELERFITKLGIRAHAGTQVVQDEPEDPDPAPGPAGTSAQAGEGRSQPAEEGRSEKAAAKKAKAKKSGEAAAAKVAASALEFRPRQVLLIKPGGKWFELEYAGEAAAAPQDPALVARYQALAQQLLEAEVALFKSKRRLQTGANTAWMKTVVSAGALADRMAAMTLLIQDAPVHTLEHVESLVAMARKRGSRRMGLMAVDTLRELLLLNLLPEHRKLRPFERRPLDGLEERASGNRDARDRRLLLWLYEHRLKQHVAEFVAALEALGRDTVAATKAAALAAAHQLLSGRPEQERALLAQLVNKLGDPEYRTAARASHLLETLLHRHPNMRAVVCGEVERLLLRPNVGARAQYYAVCFLGQVLLSRDEAPLAARLLALYFSFFRACVRRKDVDSKMLSALLTGVNRAYPYAGAADHAGVKEQLDTLFRVVHVVKFNTAVQALMLLFQVMDAQQSVSDRYYVSLYRKLLDPGLASSSRQSMFLNLLYKSLKADVALRRVKAFVKRLLQVSAEQGASFACGALFLVSEVMKAKPGLKLLLQEAGDGEEEVFKDLDEDEEERFVDADKLQEGASEEAEPKEEVKEEEEAKPTASWVHHQNMEGSASARRYEPLHRNPLFCGADRTTLWELHRLALHYHPSVALFAKTLLQGDSIQYSGDPLQDFTLIRFLDRFVFRNPKQLKGKQNTDAVVLTPKLRLPLGAVPVNCEEFLSRDESQIAVDEVFFHRFFRKRQQDKQGRRPRGHGDDESVEDVDDDEFEKLLDDFEGDSYFPSLPADDLDFAGNVKSQTGKKKKAAAGDSDSDDADDSDVDNLDDEELSLGSMDEEDFGDELEDEGGAFMDAGGDDDDEDEDVPELDEDAFAELDDGASEAPAAQGKKKKKRKSSEELDFAASLGSTPGKKKKKKDGGMLTSAEEFGSILDENAGAKFDNIGLNAMANRDKAGLKQLKWESQRDDWIHGRDAKTLRRRKTAFRRSRTPMLGRARVAARTPGAKRKRGK